MQKKGHLKKRNNYIFHDFQKIFSLYINEIKKSIKKPL